MKYGTEFEATEEEWEEIVDVVKAYTLQIKDHSPILDKFVEYLSDEMEFTHE